MTKRLFYSRIAVSNASVNSNSGKPFLRHDSPSSLVDRVARFIWLMLYVLHSRPYRVNPWVIITFRCPCSKTTWPGARAKQIPHLRFGITLHGGVMTGTLTYCLFRSPDNTWQKLRRILKFQYLLSFGRRSNLQAKQLYFPWLTDWNSSSSLFLAGKRAFSSPVIN